MGTITSFAAAAVLAASLGAGISSPAVAAGQQNPVDHVSNPAALEYSDVEIAPKDMTVRFVRDGVVTEPKLFSTIKPGLEQAQIQNLLGAPIRQRGLEWDYNFKFAMVGSRNFLVCQYKVRFDEHQLVRDTGWRRRQCQQLSNGESARE